MTIKIHKIVRTKDGKRVDGIVKYNACKAATKSGGGTCDKKLCTHNVKDKFWVMWPNKEIFSYDGNDLELDEKASKAVEVYLSKKDLPATEQKLEEIEKTKEKVDYALYNGFDKVKVDRNGKPYIIATAMTERTTPPIAEKDMDWDAYSGKKKSHTYRKIM